MAARISSFLALFACLFACAGTGAQTRYLDVGGEFGIFLNPILGVQKSGQYKLNGENIGESDAGFYCVQPGTHILEHVADILEEANTYYFPITYSNSWFNRNKRLRIIPGITHDKLQTGNRSGGHPTFGYNSGGREWTLKAGYGWNVANHIAHVLNDYKHHLILNFDLQAGAFVCDNRLKVYLISNKGDTLTADPQKRIFGSGYGFIATVYGGFGYALHQKWFFTTGFSISGQYTHNRAKVDVTKNNVVSKGIVTNDTRAAFVSPFIKVSVLLVKK